MAAEEKLADCAIIATQDQQHFGPAVALAKKGYVIIKVTLDILSLPLIISSFLVLSRLQILHSNIHLTHWSERQSPYNVLNSLIHIAFSCSHY